MTCLARAWCGRAASVRICQRNRRPPLVWWRSSKQTWTLKSDGVELELELAAATGGPLQGRLVLASGNKSDFGAQPPCSPQYPMQAPSPAAFRADGESAGRRSEDRAYPADWLRKELVFTLPAAQAGQRVRILWEHRGGQRRHPADGQSVCRALLHRRGHGQRRCAKRMASRQPAPATLQLRLKKQARRGDCARRKTE